MATISIERLKVYKRYNGDVDMFVRTATAAESKLFEMDEYEIWGEIDFALQNIKWISDEIVSEDFIINTMSSLSLIADNEAFDSLRNEISFYPNLQKIIDILKVIESTINKNTDITLTRFDTPGELTADINKDIEALEMCNYHIVDKIFINFSPTGLYQELSISNGWGEEYLKLSERFDVIYNRIKKQRESKKGNTNSKVNSRF